MIFNATQADNDAVSDFFSAMLRPATEVDRSLSEKDAMVIFIGNLVTGLVKAEARIAELETRLAAHESQSKN